MGYWITTPAGNKIHVDGGPDLDPEGLKFLGEMADAAAKLSQEQQEAFLQLWRQTLKPFNDREREARYWFNAGADYQIHRLRETNDITLRQAIELMPKPGEQMSPEAISSMENVAHRIVSFGPDRRIGVYLHRLIEHIRGRENG